MAEWKPLVKGLTTVNNPRSIDNAEHNDRSLARRVLAGEPATIKEFINPSSAEEIVPEKTILRVTNTDASTQFIYIGDSDSVPATPAISDSLALPPNHVAVLMVGGLDDPNKGPVVKTSSSNVQVAVVEVGT